MNIVLETVQRSFCALCALEHGLLQTWIGTNNFDTRGQCSCCGFVSATVTWSVLK